MKTATTLSLILALLFVVNCTQKIHSAISLNGDYLPKNITKSSQSSICCIKCNICSIKESSCCGTSDDKCYYCTEAYDFDKKRFTTTITTEKKDKINNIINLLSQSVMLISIVVGPIVATFYIQPVKVCLGF